MKETESKKNLWKQFKDPRHDDHSLAGTGLLRTSRGIGLPDNSTLSKGGSSWAAHLWEVWGVNEWLRNGANCGSPSEDPGTTNWPTDLRISNCPRLRRLQRARSTPSICKTLQDKKYQFQEPHQWETLWVLTEAAVWTTQLKVGITQFIPDSAKGSAKIGFLITQGVGRTLKPPRVLSPDGHTIGNLPLRTRESHDCDQVMALTTVPKLTERKIIWLALM